MGTNDVRVDQKLNKAVWSQGVRFVDAVDGGCGCTMREGEVYAEGRRDC
jgi:hypothetical protein